MSKFLTIVPYGHALDFIINVSDEEREIYQLVLDTFEDGNPKTVNVKSRIRNMKIEYYDNIFDGEDSLNDVFYADDIHYNNYTEYIEKNDKEPPLWVAVITALSDEFDYQNYVGHAYIEEVLNEENGEKELIITSMRRRVDARGLIDVQILSELNINKDNVGISYGSIMLDGLMRFGRMKGMNVIINKFSLSILVLTKEFGIENIGTLKLDRFETRRRIREIGLENFLNEIDKYKFKYDYTKMPNKLDVRYTLSINSITIR